ncbi:putative F-box/LRR-repeat protein 9 [Bidens hawaiensis]|uniref:putative F-box/LRR-repeat protein 9 n=1 Tax=Bidens hawaiensis TaxID=980011 RepID=UPI00404AA9AD
MIVIIITSYFLCIQNVGLIKLLICFMNGKATMPPKSNRRRNREWRVKKPTRNWLNLPSDLMLNILQRVGVIDRLENAQLVCTAWREIYKDPALWRVVYMDRIAGHYGYGSKKIQDICKHAVNRSQGQLVDLTTVGFCDYNLLRYVADRCSQLRRVELVLYFFEFSKIWSKVFKKLPLLEELNLVATTIRKKDIEAAGRYCPLLKTFKLNKGAHRAWGGPHGPESRILSMQNEIAVSIGKNLPGLTHLELVGNSMTNIGLQAILDGCCHLELLDLRRCLYLDLKGDLGKRCLQQIKYLKLPHDSLQGLPYNSYGLYETYSDY